MLGRETFRCRRAGFCNPAADFAGAVLAGLLCGLSVFISAPYAGRETTKNLGLTLANSIYNKFR